MVNDQKSDRIEITVSLATELVSGQFPEWAHLKVQPVDVSGWDNITFRLGDDMSIRLPSAKRYEAQIEKEQKWLPELAPFLSVPIPRPIAMGQPSKKYPWHWSINQWIDGTSANILNIDESCLSLIASSLAQFLKELHKIDTHGSPMAGPHNFYRGDSPVIYDSETRSAIDHLRDYYIDAQEVIPIWEKAISTKWTHNPVWVHGDLSDGNILIKDSKLAAIIDFGCIGVGDPACDLVIAWNFLTNESRKIFRNCLGLDPNTWARARGWALWKALITMEQIKDKTSREIMKQKQVINEILIENKIET